MLSKHTGEQEEMAMIRGIGIDTVVIGDVEGLLKRMSKGTLSKVFTQENCPPPKKRQARQNILPPDLL